MSRDVLFASPPKPPKPMLASPAKRPPGGPGWAYEFKWDGVRALARWDGRKLIFHSRLGNEITSRYPELQAADRLLGERAAVLDGEIIAVDASGRPSFGRLQNRMHVADASRVSTLMQTIPVAYVVFDVLWFDGESMLQWPYADRRDLLVSLDLNRDNWHTPPNQIGHGARWLSAARRLGLEGIVAKRLDSVYVPNRRASSWVKVRLDLRQEFVVAGWTPGKGNRQGEIGALLVGYYAGDSLRFAGKVGTGFDGAENARLLRLFKGMKLGVSPFVDKVPWRDARFLKPDVVAEIRFTEWTDDGKLRHPSYQGQRTDKEPRTVVRET